MAHILTQLWHAGSLPLDSNTFSDAPIRLWTSVTSIAGGWCVVRVQAEEWSSPTSAAHGSIGGTANRYAYQVGSHDGGMLTPIASKQACKEGSLELVERELS